MDDPLANHEPRFGRRTCDRIRAVALARARRSGLNFDDAEDCALACACRMWQSYKAGKISLADLHTNDTLLRGYAAYSVKNDLRALRRRGLHEKREVEFDREEDPFPDPADPHLVAESEICVRELMELIRSALSPLKQDEFDLFALRYGKDQSVFEIAGATGKTYHATKKALQRLQQKLPVLLEEAGLSWEECRDYLRLLV